MFRVSSHQIMSRSNPGINVVYALYNDVVCDDSSTVEDIGIAPFSVMYMCSDLYEIHVDLCNESSITLYKSYCTPFQTLLLDLSVVSVSEFNECNVDSRYLSVYFLQSSKEYSLSACSEQIYRLFDSSTVHLRCQQSVVLSSSLHCRVSPKSPV